jgi:hypothetical protein
MRSFFYFTTFLIFQVVSQPVYSFMESYINKGHTIESLFINNKDPLHEKYYSKYKLSGLSKTAPKKEHSDGNTPTKIVIVIYLYATYPAKVTIVPTTFLNFAKFITPGYFGIQHHWIPDIFHPPQLKNIG